MFGKRNILHFQVPFKKVNGSPFLNRLKLKNIHEVVCNSEFTKKFVDKEFSVESVVVYPPVDLKKFKKGKKENLIISVGRFSQLLQAKRQDILISSFKNLCKKGLKGWRLLLVGGSEVGGSEFVRNLRKASSGFPIRVEENVPLKNLVALYSEAKVFWAANGFGVDEKKNPEKVEHFGIAAVEAMSAGVVPLLIKKGGFKEIIEEGKSGFFWETTEELEEKTLRLTKIDLSKLEEEAVKRSLFFSKEKFYERIKETIL
jgi:glycosyltransferase involved in cell wall biosynthesis